MEQGVSQNNNNFEEEVCHGRVGTLIFILSYLRARDPERILLYIDRGTFVF